MMWLSTFKSVRAGGVAFGLVVALSACSPLMKGGTFLDQRRWKNGDYEADRAIVALMKGNIDKAEMQTRAALEKNPRHPYALLTGAIIYENTGRPHRAQQYYEDILAYRPRTLALLGKIKDLTPVPVADIAHERTQVLDLRENPLVWPSIPGEEQVPTFNMSGRPAPSPEARHPAESTQNVQKKLSGGRARKALERHDPDHELFGSGDRNAISRFLTVKKLAEEGLITRDEYVLRRQANIGALLPYTKQPSAAGLERKVPSTEMIVSRLRALRRAFETRAISAREHAAERGMILDALLPANPAVKANMPPPPADLLEAATGLRRLEALNEMGLITGKELEKESHAIEQMVKYGEDELAAAIQDQAGASEPQDSAEKSPHLLVPGVAEPAALGQKGSRNSARRRRGKMGVHVASFGKRENATKARQKLREKYSALQELPARIEKTNLGSGKGVFHRLEFGPVGGERAANDLCERLRRKGEYCVPISFEN